MGSVYEAYCGCGLSEKVTAGGSRRTFLEESGFPFLCAHCGLVSVNVAQLPRGQVVTECPDCHAPGCTQYGIPPVSLHGGAVGCRPARQNLRHPMHFNGVSAKRARPATDVRTAGR